MIRAGDLFNLFADLGEKLLLENDRRRALWPLDETRRRFSEVVRDSALTPEGRRDDRTSAEMARIFDELSGLWLPTDWKLITLAARVLAANRAWLVEDVPQKPGPGPGIRLMPDGRREASYELWVKNELKPTLSRYAGLSVYRRLDSGIAMEVQFMADLARTQRAPDSLQAYVEDLTFWLALYGNSRAALGRLRSSPSVIEDVERYLSMARKLPDSPGWEASPVTIHRAFNTVNLIALWLINGDVTIRHMVQAMRPKPSNVAPSEAGAAGRSEGSQTITSLKPYELLVSNVIALALQNAQLGDVTDLIAEARTSSNLSPFVRFLV